VGKPVLIGETRSRDRPKTCQEVLVDLLALERGRERMVCEPVVVTVVTEISGPLRKFPEIGFILLVKKSVLRGQPLGNRLQFLSLSWANTETATVMRRSRLC